MPVNSGPESTPLSLQTAVAFLPRFRYPPYFDREITDYNQALLAPYGMTFEPALTSSRRNFTFAALAEQLLYSAPDSLPRPDLVMVAYALPDPHSPEKTLVPHLSTMLGGQSTGFAISEQGLAAPFTALRVADAYARSRRCGSAALFILEQAAFPYRLPTGRDGDLMDSGVLVFLGQGGSWDVTGARSAGPRTGLAELIRVPAGHCAREVLLVTGPWIDPGAAALGLKIHQAPPGSYCTSVWLELARHHQDWVRDYKTIVLLDTDPGTGVSQALTLSRTGAQD